MYRVVRRDGFRLDSGNRLTWDQEMELIGGCQSQRRGVRPTGVGRFVCFGTARLRFSIPDMDWAMQCGQSVLHWVCLVLETSFQASHFVL
jgi:hypothetical protein